MPVKEAFFTDLEVLEFTTLRLENAKHDYKNFMKQFEDKYDVMALNRMKQGFNDGIDYALGVMEEITKKLRGED